MRRLYVTVIVLAMALLLSGVATAAPHITQY